MRYAFLLALSFVVATSIASAQSQKPSPSCSSAEHHQFDFWAGDWDAYDIDNLKEVAARVHVDRVLDSCVLLEKYVGKNGLDGQSFSIYDGARKVWHQTWVTNHGQLLEVDGAFENGTMVLRGTDNVKHALVRVTWKPVNGNVQETAVTSTDNGKTWTQWFDMLFRRHTAK